MNLLDSVCLSFETDMNCSVKLWPLICQLSPLAARAEGRTAFSRGQGGKSRNTLDLVSGRGAGVRRTLVKTANLDTAQNGIVPHCLQLFSP